MRVMLAIALVLGITGTGIAQQTSVAGNDVTKEHHKNHKGQKEIKSPEDRARLFTASLDKHLNLSDAQEKEIYNIQLESGKKFEAMRSQRTAGTKQHHSAGKSYAEGTDKINNVLTAKQRIAYQQLKEERMKKIKEHKAQYKNVRKHAERDSTQSRNPHKESK